MIWLMKWLVFGHVHKWQTEKWVTLENTTSGETGRRYYLRCECCGDVRHRDLI